MSQNIDKRIVEMKFDNKQFESGIQTSVKSLDKLKQGLDFDKAVKGLHNLEKAGRSFNLSGMSDSISAIKDRFSAMGIVGMTVIQDITHSVYNCGKKMASALTVDPIKTGLAEYETQIGAIQTILANTSDAMDKKGFSQQKRLDIVNDKLDELNAYADKTIYNFTEMTRNIGTFTAAGVELDTAVSSIKGIANLAAVSGSTSQQASTAMYQLSQAISSGTVRLADWNSVVNAGMGGELFQKALARTATAMGVTIDKTVTEVDSKGRKVRKTVKKTVDGLIDDAGSFRNSLSDGWLTSDVLTATLNQMAMDFEQIAKENSLYLENGAADIEAAKNLMRSSLVDDGYTNDQIEEIINLAEMATKAATEVKTVTELIGTLKESLQSGWTQSWEYIIGDFGEAKELLTGISDYFGEIIGRSADSRNALLADWKKLGGRNALIDTFWNIVHSVENVAKVIKDAFTEFFPPTTGKQLFDITKKISDFANGIKQATENSELMNKVSRIFRGVAAALDIVRSMAKLAWDGLKKLLGLSKGAPSGILEFIADIGDWIVNLRDFIKNSEQYQHILEKLGSIADAVRKIFVSAFKKISTVFTNLWGKISETGIFSKLNNKFNVFTGKLYDFIEVIKSFGKVILDWVKDSEILKTAWSSIKGFFEPIAKGIAGFSKKIWEAIHSFFGVDTVGEKSLLGKIKLRLAAFGESMSEGFESVKQKIAETWSTIKAYFVNLFTKIIPDFFRNVKMNAVTRWPWLDQVFDFVKRAWAKITSVCEPIIEQIKIFGKKLWDTLTSLFYKKTDSQVVDEELSFGQSLANVFSYALEKLKAFFISVNAALNEIEWGGILKAALGIYTGLKLLIALKGIGKLGMGLVAVGNGLKDAGDFLKKIGEEGLTLTRVFKKEDSFATSILKVAAAIGLLVGSIIILAEMKADKAWKGIGLLTLLAGELLIITKVFREINANGDALLKAAGAVTLLVIPVFLLGSMDVGTAIKGVIGIGFILAELAMFMKLAGKGMDKKQSLIGLGIAVNLLIIAVRSLGTLNIGTALKGVLGLGTILLMIGLFANKTKSNKIRGLISMALAVNLLVLAVKGIGKLNPETLIKGVLGLGGVMAAFAVLIKFSQGFTFGNALLTLITMAGSIFIFVEMFKIVEALNMDNVLKFSLSIALTIRAMAIAMKLISSLTITRALTGLGSFALWIVGIGAIAIGLSALKKQWPEMEGMLDEGGVVLRKLGFALGSFFGGALDGLIRGDGLPTLGTNLSDFMTNAQGFIDGAKNIDADITTGINSFVSTVAAIGGTEFWNAIAGLFMGENPVTKFSKDIIALGFALSAFALSVLPMALVPTTVLDRAVSVAAALADIAGKIPVTGGVLSLLTNIGELGIFSTQLKSLGTGLVDFATEVSAVENSAFNQTKIDAVVSIATALAQIETALEGQGGLEDLVEGTKSLANFSSGIPTFGHGINAFIGQVRLVKYDPNKDGVKMEAVIGIGTKLSELEKGLEGQGGFEDLVEGTKSLANFSSGIPTFGHGINAFIGQVRLVKYDQEKDGAKVDAVIGIGTKLSELEKGLEGQGGLEDLIEGTKSLETFGKNIPDFSTGINGFITEVSTLDDKNYDADKIKTALSVATAINEINNNLVGTDGWVQGIMGTQDLGLFATNIKSVGEALASFSTSVSGSTVDEATDATTALDTIRTFTETLSKDGGLWQNIGKWFGGSKENTLLGYAANMRTVGEDLNAFSTNIEAVDIANIGKASDVVEAIRTFISGLETEGGILELFGNILGGTQENTLTNMSGAMATFGTNIGSLADGIKSIDVTATNFEGAKQLLKDFKVFYDEVEQYEDISQSSQMNDLLWYLDDFGMSLAEFHTALGTTDVGRLSSASSIIQTLVSIAESVDDVDPSNVAIVGNILDEYGKISFQGFINGFTASSGDAVSAVRGLISQISTVIQNDETLSMAAGGLSETCVSAFKLTWVDWNNAGSYLGSGIANGIESMAGRIRTSAIGAARGAINAIRITWSINSPSKVGEELGRYWDLGLSGGMDKYAGLVSQSSSDIGRSAIDTARSVLNNLSYMTDGIDSDLTIKPVMDLSDVTSGFQTIDGLFNSQRTMEGNFFGGITSLRSGRAMMTEQNGMANKNDNRDVVNELQSLSKRFDELSNAVSNMQVVLDTGVLVGQTASQMDAQLGTYASRRGRGN